MNILTKEQFLQQYILNRSKVVCGSLEGYYSAIEANKAWEQMQFLLKEVAKKK